MTHTVCCIVREGGGGDGGGGGGGGGTVDFTILYGAPRPRVFSICYF